ncbi:DEAD/DEAH box helicase [Fictibacillus phosphorivorans]|uniref:DEAD/DEAH box helicase n=1 Tax=Fictibacillus phosphorivorans TaxID=1221500 RepID=UPI001292D85A|nr:DEAD/DEAH box helicase family protein [Fictibacillus phosphorivorans]MQR94195.1 hypothetical protein [Fictibacillus phosphorivorans]
MIELKNFQIEKVNELVTSVTELIENNVKNSICVFQSPTGSGKTIMTGQFIKDLISTSPHLDLCFLWVSIGKGDLHVQSKNKIERFFGGAPSCSLVEQEFGGYRTEIARNEVVFVNWEKLRNKDNKTNTWSNNLMKKGEKISFPEVLENTREKRQIVLIMDESHYGTNTERANEIKDIISANVLIHVSATPAYIPNMLEISEKRAGYVYVKAQSVIDEGMIKKEVLINEGVDLLSDELTSLQAILQAAIDKRDLLKAYYEEEETNVNPLVLIQIPNSDAGNERLEVVKKYLREKGIDLNSEKLAIWTSDFKSSVLDEENIDENNHPLEFLIFKQAIDTGWDCPRAQILIKLREIKSETFNIQTVGRILRMPEQKHYIRNEDLNRAYIFTNIESILIAKEDYNPNIIKDLHSVVRKNQDTELGITSYYRSRTDYGNLTRKFYDVFEKVAKEKFNFSEKSINFQNHIQIAEGLGYDFSFKYDFQSLKVNVKIKGDEVDRVHDYSLDGGNALFLYEDKDIQELFEYTLKSNFGSFSPKRSLSPAKMAIYKFFKIYFGSDDWVDEIKNIQIIFLKNKNYFIPIFLDAIEAYKPVYLQEVDQKSTDYYDENYQLPGKLYHNKHTEEIVAVQSYIYSPCYLNITRSNPEKRFEGLIDTHASIEWWWKNGENKKDYFGIKYEFNGNVHTFYPDYIIKTTDNRLGLLEVKDESDREGITFTTAKAEALYNYLLEENNNDNKKFEIFGGIVIHHNGRHLFNNKDNYDWNKVLSNDWSEWSNFEEYL